MPSSWLHIHIRMNDKPLSWAVEQIASKATGADGRLSARRAFQAIWDILGGDINFYVDVTDESGANPTGAIGVTQANAAGDTITFTYKTRTVVLTEGAAGVNGFSRGTSNAELAQNLAAAIRRHPVLGGLVRPTAGAASVTLAGTINGTTLHKLTMTTSDATAFALTQLTGGTDSAAGFMPQHVWTGRR